MRGDEFKINDEAWERGWRQAFGSAIDHALERYPDGAEAKIEEIWVIKRGDQSFHDYRVVLTPGP